MLTRSWNPPFLREPAARMTYQQSLKSGHDRIYPGAQISTPSSRSHPFESDNVPRQPAVSIVDR
jgi:hypothetical protein